MTSASTRLIHPPAPSAPAVTTVNPSVQRGSTVLVKTAAELYDDSVVSYGRSGLATQDALRAGLCALEGAEQSFLFPSGAAAVAGALLAVLQAGDEILVQDCVYRPTRRLCDGVLRRFGVTTKFFGARASLDEIGALITERTRLIMLESPGSLTFEFSDIPAIAALAKSRGVLTAIDNTWGAGLLFRPLQHGVDLSIQALTKYVGGHADVFMGSVAVTDAALVAKLDQQVCDLGWAVSPDDAYTMLRGLKTLAPRMKAHEAGGLAVARWLAQQPQVRQVLHPALDSHPDHALWARDFSGANGLFGFVLHDVPEPAVLASLDRLHVFGLGFSWGGFESLAVHCGPQLARPTGRPDFGGPLVRLHIGLEDPEDLIADLQQAFTALG
jgi:cystathionine beta-lyase